MLTSYKKTAHTLTKDEQAGKAEKAHIVPLGLLAGETTKVATIEDINEAAAAGRRR